jgi:hypothetical protein
MDPSWVSQEQETSVNYILYTVLLIGISTKESKAKKNMKTSNLQLMINLEIWGRLIFRNMQHID